MSLYTQRNSLPLFCFNWKKYELVEAWYEHYRDDFDDGVFDDEWTMHGLGVDKTIEEDAIAETVTIEVANNTQALWWCNLEHQNKCPKMYIPLGVLGPCRITTQLNSYAINDDTLAGIFIGTSPTGWGAAGSNLAFLWGRWEGANHARVQSNCGSGDIMAIAGGAPYFPTLLQIRIDADNKITFWLNPNGAGWQQYTDTIHGWTEISGYDIANSYVGLFAKNIVAVAPTDIAAPFEYFLIEVYEARSPTEEECYAPIDTRSKASSVFYDGYVKSMSNLKRAIDDKTGLFQIADLNLTLQNATKYFSSKLTNRILKNQEVIMYHAWTDEAEANKSHFMTFIVEDHSIKGPDFLVKLKDISQKYFTIKVPKDICTSDDYPNIHADYEGWVKPEVLGVASVGAGHEHQGAVQAVYVDTTTGRFIAANRPLHDITEVYLDDALQNTPGDYTWFVMDGDTYIDFGVAPTDEVVSFNAEGYSRGAWDSVNGFIENPAYIILFYLRFIMGIPASLIDIPAFTALADYYEAVGEEKSCYLVLQERQDAMEVLRQIVFTAGAKGWINMDGEFTAARKDTDDWTIANTDYHIFEQTDLIGSPHRKWNLTAAINTITSQFGYIPWQRLYAGATSEYRDNRYGDQPAEDEVRDRHDYLEI